MIEGDFTGMNKAVKTSGISSQRRALLAQVHIARKELALDDDTYRAVLKRVTGRSSARDIDDAGLRAVLAEFRRHGWQPRRRRGRGINWRPASPYPHVRKVWAVWGELKRRGIWRDPRRNSLARFVRRMTGVDDPDWLTAPQAHDVIEALKEMGERAGINWQQVLSRRQNGK